MNGEDTEDCDSDEDEDDGDSDRPNQIYKIPNKTDPMSYLSCPCLSILHIIYPCMLTYPQERRIQLIKKWINICTNGPICLGKKKSGYSDFEFLSSINKCYHNRTGLAV